MVAVEKKSVLVIGHRGMLGTDLMEIFGKKCVLSCADIAEVDIRDISSVRRCIEGNRPEIVINAAAYTDVDGAENNRERAFAVNGLGAKNVALVAREIGAASIYFSTDYVFDGTKREPYVEDDPPNPLGIYAQSKLAGETGVREADPDALIVRTAWLFGKNGRNFVDTIIRMAGTRDRLDVVDDQRGAPTWTKHLSVAVENLIEVKAKGTVHVTSSGEVTWYEFAKRILQKVGENIPVEPITTSKLNRPAPRPSYSVLSNSRYEKLTGQKMPSWEEALDGYLKER